MDALGGRLVSTSCKFYNRYCEERRKEREKKGHTKEESYEEGKEKLESRKDCSKRLVSGSGRGEWSR